MNRLISGLSILALCLCANLVKADKISGVPLADFAKDELIVPCVKVENYDETINNKFYDVVFQRRGNSFNYELTLAEVEDAGHCQRTAAYSIFDDDDFDSSDDSTNSSAPKILLNCEKRSSGRSKISVDGKNLPSGSYSSTVTSGSNEVSSPVRSTTGDEIEFDFDSQANEAGATLISPNFIGTNVTGRIINASGQTLLTATVDCVTRN